MILLSLALLAACDGDKGPLADEYEISEDTLSGLIDGEAWTFGGGESNAYLSDDTHLFAVLYGDSYDSCGTELPEGNSIIVNVPLEEGDYEMSSTMNGTFVYGDGSENNVSFNGRVVVDEVGAERVSGGMYMIFNSDTNFEVSGQFIVDICAE